MITITVTDVADPTVTFRLSADTVAENGGTTMVTATADKAFERTVFVTVQFQDGDGSPLSADNLPFTVTGNTTLVFVKGETKSEGSLMLKATNNNAHNADDVTVTITANTDDFHTANGVRVEQFKAAKLTIEDDDVP